MPLAKCSVVYLAHDDTLNRLAPTTSSPDDGLCYVVSRDVQGSDLASTIWQSRLPFAVRSLPADGKAQLRQGESL
jgi:hypothetical protein